MKGAGVVAAGLVLLTALAFQGVARNDFVLLDDGAYVSRNPVVSGGLTARGLGWAFTTTLGGNWHPLTWLSHMADVQLFGLRPAGHHLVSLALHAASTVLLFAVLRGLSGALWRPALVAALFAVHPLHVESVAWAAERKDVLSTLLELLAILAYLSWVRRPAARRAAAVAACFALALLAKPMPVTLPFLLLLLDWWPLGRWSPSRGAPPGAAAPAAGVLPPVALWREKLPLFALAAAAGAAAFAAQRAEGAVPSAAVLPFPVRAANAAVSLVRYLELTAWPAGLSVFYPHPSFLPPWRQWFGALLLLAAACAFIARAARRRPWLGVGWLWYLGTLAPVLGLVQVGAQAMADRYTYFPLVGVFVILSWTAGEPARAGRRRAAVAAVAVVAVLCAAGATVVETARWRDSETLFTRALALAGDGGGAAVLPPGAAPDARAALGAAPSLAFLHNLVGMSLAEKGRTEEAALHFRRALALNPHLAAAQGNLGAALEARGQLGEAEALYAQAAAGDPRDAGARSRRGALLLGEGRSEEAAALFREAAAIDPRDPAPRSNLGAALAALGRAEEAERALREAIALAPRYVPARFNLGRLLLGEGRAREAAAELRETLRLRPDHAEARALLSRAEAREGT